MSKSADAFRTISEVADWLGVQAHVLRFWESKFTQIKPVKRAGGRRYYRPADMLLLGGIRKLLHKDGLSIKEVQAILRDHGIAHVSQMSHDLESDGPPVEEAAPKARSVEKVDPAAIPPQEVPAAAPEADVASAQVAFVEPTAPAQPHPEIAQPQAVQVAPESETPAAVVPEPSVETAVAPPEVTAPAPSSEPEATQSEPVAPDVSAGIENESSPPPAPAPEVVAESSPPAEAQVAAEPQKSPAAAQAASVVEPTVTPSQTEQPVANAAPEVVAPAEPVLAASTPEPEQMHMELDSPAEAAPNAQVPLDTEEAPQETTAESSGPARAAAPLQDTVEPLAPSLADTAPSVATVSDSPAAETETVGAPQQPLATLEPAPPQAETADVAAVEPPLAELAQEMTPPVVQQEAPEITTADPEPIAAQASADPVTNVLSLLEHTSRLPAHVKAEVADCAAELRAILAAG
ncbi:MerR family transcriptional regulator [Phaeobacter sp. 11ANDIMAR09]|uniref:MerR family transcriptional regulator n=1 Tax=Phaeobacter sp. 11ANDIMAR09 TaxID=1225647 RepID=UPI0009FB6644|nr:MerR family transcriptional regulator [Phaeobacter sp. 11ANDIMAR09]